MRRLYGAIVLYAGIMHFFKERNFRKIVPPFLPFKKTIVYLTGVIEIVLGAMLVLNKGTKLAGRGLALFLVAVWPANIYMAQRNFPIAGKRMPAALWGRVLFQIPLIKWALNISKK
ncbi:DoxX family protein [Jeotgalibacillus haloalkalitolerans]|uniref:DoxX family membrane protein n=1 Tax=Jeotgalibacillus haloalkalitolerans TaxID=3104292 RepID=A0ABU5KLE1_9BACL|nr:DoxX family membrane protein [Jeotgalibacillus sp. HH7-29]MDZ5712087.1 DoxX family membrane protein [Jeotgalibacillus sp. HH7-29]